MFYYLLFFFFSFVIKIAYMNQEQVKNILLTLEDSKEFFSLIFTGKASKKVNGFYSPSEKSIYIHNKNMSTDNQLIYTAIHEYAHHIQNCSSPLPISSRCHTKDFYAIFHRLLQKAKELSIYSTGYENYPKLLELTNEIKEHYLKENGVLMANFGKKLLEAQKLCFEYNVNFKDYLNSVLSLELTTAKKLIDISVSNIDPSLGYDNMKTVVSMPSKNRASAVAAFLNGTPPEVVKNEFSGVSMHNHSLYDTLVKEKIKIERTIANLSSRLEEIQRRIDLEMGYEKV